VGKSSPTAMTVQPTDLSQQRSINGILAETARLYWRYPLLFAILALAVMAPYELAVLGITGYGPLRHTHEGTAITFLLLILKSSLITPLISAMHMHAVVAIGAGQRPRLAAVARRGLSVLPVVAAAEIMATLGIVLGFIALVVPGIVLSLRWAVVAQAASLEGEGWLAALSSSGRLTSKHYGRVFALLLLFAILGFGVYRGAWALPLGSTSGAPSVAVGIAIDSIIASFSALTLALLYFDLRASADPRRVPEREHPHLRDLDPDQSGPTLP
jgi:hypothetical protein